MESIDESLIKILQNKATGTVAIFERSDFYTVYEDDAFLVANEIFLSEIGIRYTKFGNHEVRYHNLNTGQYNRVVRDVLLLMYYRLEVYTISDDRWILKAKGSLGCLNDFEEVLGDCAELSELSTVMALLITKEHRSDEYRLSVGFCNARDLKMTIAEFPDTAHFPNLEKCMLALMPRECIISTRGVLPLEGMNFEESLSHLNTTLKRANVERIPYQWDVDEDRYDLAKFISQKYKGIQVSENQKKCLWNLSQYLHLDESYECRFALIDYKSAGFMYMDMAAVKALELFSVSYDEDGGTSGAGSLFELMNKCRTQHGQRLLREWMRRPLYDLRKINERLDVVEALYNDASSRSIIYDDILRRVPDVASLSRKLLMKKAALQDCYRLYQLIRLLKRLERILMELHSGADNLAPSVNDVLLEPIRVAVLQFEKFADLIETTVDVEYCERTGVYRIKPEIDESLLSTAEQMTVIENECKKVFVKVCNKVPEAVKLDSNAQHGFFLRVTLKAEKSLRQMGFSILETNKGTGVRFTTRELDKLNADYVELQKVYDNTQQELIKMVIETCAGYVNAFNQLSEVLACIDVLIAFSVVASRSTSIYTRPELLDKGSRILELKRCRHPVLETLPNISYIPNDIVMNNESDGTRFLLLTGANMGGKSTYLRSCALSILLAQIGSFVPCDQARFSLIDGIHTRIGSCDYQCKGISTFMAEMIDCASILESATSNSLVIIDELGRGTSTYDGFGLAWAIAEDLLSRVQCFCIFATHFHEMAELHNKYPEALKTMRVETKFDEIGNLTLLYQVVPGVAERSFGLNIAKLVGLPDAVLESAEEYLIQLENHSSNVKLDEELIKYLKSLKGEELRETILSRL